MEVCSFFLVHIVNSHSKRKTETRVGGSKNWREVKLYAKESAPFLRVSRDKGKGKLM